MTSISTLGQALTQVERIKLTQTQLATLQNQLASGKKTQLFKGLGTDVIASERARASFQELDNYKNNIDIADRRLKIMLNGLGEIKAQAGNLVNALQIQTQSGEFELETVSDLAEKVGDFVRNLINEKDGERFLFGGSETLSQPLSDTGTLNTYVQTQFNDWINTNIDTDTLINSYRDRSALTDTLVGYSAPLSSGTVKNVFIRVEEQTELDYTVLANNDGLRDIVVAAAVIENFDNAIDEVTLDVDDPPPPGTVVPPGADNSERNANFYQMFNDLVAMMNNALDEIETQEFQLSQVQAQISQIADNHKLEQNILAETIGDVEDIDLNEVAVSLNSLSVQLEASFRVTASLQGLSLVNFL